MKKNYVSQFLIVFLFSSISIVAQTEQEKKTIIKNYDLAKLNNLKEKYTSKFISEKNEAVLLAAQKGWDLTYTDANGSFYELAKISKEGKPLYFKTDNVDAAISTRANFMHNNGGLGLNIEGQEMTAYVWDGGLARATHQEYDGIGGDDRYSVGDATSALSFHAAHVTGTIIASGFEPSAKGMAPQANAVGNDWNNDLAEATSAAANGMLLSNHSYGYGAENIPDWWFGAYTEDARDWDNLLYNAPYYLKVVSAGNDGNDGTSNDLPLDGNNLFDKLNGDKTSKNSLIIANGQDATINTDGTLASVVRNTSSSEGPTDDLRVKPDLMGNGTGLFSTYENADDAYNTISGTSMASPNVTGSLLLLQQYYKELYGNFMRAATLKGLALHTADDTDIPGPDSHTGWGLMNTKKAAETIKKNGFESWISEEVLKNGSTYSIKVKSDGLNPLLASISWTDKPGIANEGTPNDATPALVNDLDITVTKENDEFKPWRLTGLLSNEKADNLVDPFERVDIDNPTAGEYTITVTHKGTLDEDQRFSLVVTGISGEFTFLADSSEKTTCSEEEKVFNFEYRQAIASNTEFTATGAPEEMSVVFSDTSLSANGNFTITFGNLTNVPAGSYDIEVTGDNGNETQKRNIRLIVNQQNFENNPSELQEPFNGEKGTSTNVTLAWKNNLNANNYTVEVSKNPSFTNLLFSENIKGIKADVNNLELNTAYYWRIKPKNDCAEGNYSLIYSFQTGNSDCTKVYTATDFSNAAINPFLASVTATVPINITENVIINKINVTVDISHTAVKDLTILLEAPESIGATRTMLFSEACDDTNNISNTTFDDNAADLICSTTDPAISGTVKPFSNLSAPFIGKDAFGEWKLIVLDNASSNGGQINSVSINFCSPVENSNAPSFSSTNLILGGNTSYVITPSNMTASSASETEEQQVYTLVEATIKGNLEKEGVAINIGDTFTQADINSGKIVFTNSETVSFSDTFKVDVTNAAKGWLPNQIVTIQENTLSVSKVSLDSISYWPNPTKAILNVKINNVSSENIIISLFDLQGRKVTSSVSKPTSTVFTKEISTKNITSGVYLLTVEHGAKKTTKKIVVSK